MSESKYIICLDLDDTIFPQRIFDNQVIDHAIRLLYMDYKNLPYESKVLSNLIKCEREKDRLTKNLFNKVFSRLCLSAEICNTFIYYYKFCALEADILIRPSKQALLFLQSMCSQSLILIITNGNLFVQQRKIDLLNISYLINDVIILDGNSPRFLKPDTGFFIDYLDNQSLRLSSQSFMIGDSIADQKFAETLNMSYYHPVFDLHWNYED